MDEPSFLKAHSSVLFVLATGAFGGLCLFVSTLLAKHPVWAGFLEHLGAICVVASVAAVFFSFREVREVLAGSVSVLLIDGDVARHFGDAERDTLRRRLLLQSLQKNVTTLPESMMEHLDRVMAQCLAKPYLTNYHVRVELSDAEQPGLIHRHYVCHYLVNARHLKAGRGDYPLRVRHEIASDKAAQEVVKRFEVSVGEETFGLIDAKVDHDLSGGTPVTVVSFTRNFTVSTETSVSIDLVTLCGQLATTEVFSFTAPTEGCHATLSYKKDMLYDVVWFGPPHGKKETMPNSITAYTNDWLLPGEGLLLCAEQADAPVAVQAVNNTAALQEEPAHSTSAARQATEAVKPSS